MQRIVFSLDEITAASKLFRATSQMATQGTAMVTVHANVAELELSVGNLRRLEPIPEEQQLYISGAANFTVYHVWLAGGKMEPLYLGSFNAPLFGQGHFFYTFDPNNVNNSGFTLADCKWLLVTASPGARYNLWMGEATAAVLYGLILPAQNGVVNAAPPMSLFEARKKGGLDDDAELDLELFDEDDDEIEMRRPKKRYKRRRSTQEPRDFNFPGDDDGEDDDLEP